MLSKKVEDLSIREILMQLGVPTGIEDIRAAYRFNTPSKRLIEFEKKLTNLDGGFDDLVAIFEEYEDIFDKEIYIFHVAKLLEQDMIEGEKAEFLNTAYRLKMNKSPENQKHNSSLIATAKKLLSVSDVADLTIDKLTRNVLVDLSQDYIGNSSIIARRNMRTERKMAKIEEIFGTNNILKVLCPSDLADISRYPNFGNVLAINIFKGIKNKKKEQEIKDHNINKTYYWSEFKKVLKENMQYIDTDKMLLLYASVNFERQMAKNLSADEVNSLKEIVDKVYTLLDDNNTTIRSLRYKEEINFLKLKKDIDSLNNRFEGSEFYSDKRLLDIIDSILNRNDYVSNYSEKIISELFRIDPDCLVKFCLVNATNFKFLVDKNYIKDIDFKQILNNKLSIDVMAYLLIINKIDFAYIEKEYDSKEMHDDDLRTLKSFLSDEDINRLLDDKRLLNLYFKSKTTEEYAKYLRIYQIFKIEDRDLDYRIKVGKKLINLANEHINNEELMSFYREGFVPIELVASSTGNTIVSLYAIGLLKPNETRKLFDQKIITFEMFAEFLKDKQYNDFIKISSIFGLFSSKDDKIIRNKLLDYYFQYSRKDLKPEVKMNKFAIPNVQFDPCNIWNNIKDTDEEFTQEVLKDGFIIFKLPNKNKYFIQKVFGPKREFIYGSAAYIFDKEFFDTNRDDILFNNQIRIDEVESKLKKKGVYKIVNTGWENTIEKYLEFKKENKYSEEQESKIKQLLNKVMK